MGGRMGWREQFCHQFHIFLPAFGLVHEELDENSTRMRDYQEANLGNVIFASDLLRYDTEQHFCF